MSRVGKMPIAVPKEVKVELQGDFLMVKGPKGELKRQIRPEITLNLENDLIAVMVNGGSRSAKALHGLFRALIANMVHGVSQGFEKGLEIVGIGYRAELSGRRVTFHLGYSHPIDFDLPEGIEAKIDKTRITLTGIDKELLGMTAAKIRGFRKPEPYKGKGIRYTDEMVRRKAGKTGAK